MRCNRISFHHYLKEEKMDTAIKKIEQIARAAERQSREALNKAIATEVALLAEIETLKEQVAALSAQLSEKKPPSKDEKTNALLEVLADCYQRGDFLSQEEWTEIRKAYVPDGDSDLKEVKEFFLRGNGKDLYATVVKKPEPSPEPAPSPVPAPIPEPAPSPAPAPKKRKMKGRVSTEPSHLLVDSLDDPDSVSDAPPTPSVSTPIPAFAATVPASVDASLAEIQQAGALTSVPRERLAEISSVLRSALIGADTETCKDAVAKVEAMAIETLTKKQTLHMLMEGASPTALQPVLDSSAFAAECFSTMFF